MKPYYKIAWLVYGMTLFFLASIFMVGFVTAKIWFPREVIRAEFITSTSTPKEISILKEQKECKEKGGEFYITEITATYKEWRKDGKLGNGYNLKCFAPEQPDIFNYEIR